MTAAPAVAIVGMACRYADVTDAGELWHTVLGRRRGFRLLPEQRLGAGYRGTAVDQTYVTYAGLLRGWEFDRAGFGVPGPLFRAVDQTHWLALQTSAEALADAGHPDASGLDRERVGVVFGNSLTGEFSRAGMLRLRWPFIRRAALAALAANDVVDAERVAATMRDLVRQPFPEPGDESLAGALSNTIAGRVCNYFDFHGTGYTVDGACASSLLAVMTACRALATGELDFALAGGVDLSLDPFELVGFARMGALAEGGDMRVYDARPTGFLPGEGCGVVALMRADDAARAGHRRYATISGWGMSSDGAGGLTRPEHIGQARAVRRAYEMARIDPSTAALYEGHGTGTAVGDPVELRALHSVRNGAATKAAIGSVKANIGHTKAAAGVAGLIKAALAVHHRVLPPTTGCETPHDLLRRADSAVRVLDEAEPWPRPEVVAGVSSMGFGGINAHLVLTGADRAEGDRPVPFVRKPPKYEIVRLTAADPGTLAGQLTSLGAVAASLSFAELHDLAATEHQRSDNDAPIRCALVAESPDRLATAAAQAARVVATWDGSLVVATDAGFVVAGQGHHRVGLLFPGQAAPVRGALDEWAHPLDIPEAGVPLREGDTDTAIAQPAIVRQSLAAIAWLDAIGCAPVGAVGHSLGEISALVWAGAVSAVDGLRLAVDRGALMAEHGVPGTTMAAVGLPPDRVRVLLDGTPVTIAGFNGPAGTTVAGPEADVRDFVRRATSKGATATVLAVSHGFHSEAMRPVATPLANRLSRMTFRAPLRPVYSTVTGEMLRPADDLAAVLVEQLTRPVRLADAVELLSRRCDLLVEAGPGTTLAPLVSNVPVVSMDCGGSGRGHALTMAALATVGAADLDVWFRDRGDRWLDRDAPISLLANPCESEVTRPADRTTAEEEKTGEEIGEDRDSLEVLRDHLSRTLELPRHAVRPDSRLLGDLHLNSLQVVQVIAEVAGKLGRRVPVLTESVAESTIAGAAELIASEPQANAMPVAPGVRPWVRAFEHRWRPWENPERTGPCRWAAHAPEDHWLHDVTARSTVDSAAAAGLALWLGRRDGSAEIVAALHTVATRKPDVLTVVHDGHPAAPAVARMAAVELDVAQAVAIEAPPELRDVDLHLTGGCLRLREGQVERLGTAVRPLTGDVDVLRPGEVCLVTGGVTGITARCARELATRTGCSLVLLGRSADDTEHVRAALADLPGARYIRCDVADPSDVRAAARTARALGPVRGLLHGAGVNEPQPIPRVTRETLVATLRPKVAGLRVLLDEFGDDLGLAVGFGSIIGRRGLRGQAEYCIANELLRTELESWAQAHPACRTRVLEWSAWAGVGMAERMGVLTALRDQGLVPIEPDMGVAAFLAAVGDTQAPVTLLVSGRFPPGPTLTVDGPDHEPLRFSTDVVVRVPGVEAVVEPVISTGTDPYLEDHRIDGVAVLPAVVGLEAAAQAAAAVVGEQDGWSFTGVELTAPILVGERESRAVRLAALANEAPGSGVDVVIHDAVDRFRATVHPAPPADERAAVATRPPRYEEPHPFYGPLFFHTGRLRSLLDYEHLSAFEVRAWVRAGQDGWFSGFHSPRLLLGDIAANDAMIHVLLACLPHRTALPTAAERVTIWRPPHGDLLVSARERAHTADEYLFDVRVHDPEGRAVARWDGLRLKAIEPRHWSAPLPVRLVGPWLSRRLIECGLADDVELVSDVDGIRGDADVVWASGPAGEQDRLAAAIAHKADEPTAVAATRVHCARRAAGHLLTGRQLVIDEVVDDALVVLSAGRIRVTTAKLAAGRADPLVIAVVSGR